MPYRASVIAATNPAGPPPTTTTWCDGGRDVKSRSMTTLSLDSL